MADFPWEEFGGSQVVDRPPWEEFGQTEQTAPVGLSAKQKEMQMTPMTPPEQRMSTEFEGTPRGPLEPWVDLPRMDISPAMPKALQVAGGLVNTGAGLAEGMLNPLMLATLPAGVISGTGKAVGAMFAGHMASQTPAAVENFAETVYDPTANLGEKVEAGANAAALPLFAYAAGKPALAALKREMSIIKPEVLPPAQPPIAPLNRQLPAPERPFIDTEFVDPLLQENNFQPRTEVAPVGGAKFVVDPAARTLPVEQLTPLELREAMRGPREYVPRESVVRPAQASPVIIGEQVRQAALQQQAVKDATYRQMNPVGLPPIVQLKQMFDAQQRQVGPVFFEPKAQEIQPVVVPSKPPVEPTDRQLPSHGEFYAGTQPTVTQGGMPSRGISRATPGFSEFVEPKTEGMLALTPMERQVVEQFKQEENLGPAVPSGVSYRAPVPAPSIEQAARIERRANVERGLTIEQPPMEPLPQEVGQYPETITSTRALSRLQRERLKLAIKRGGDEQVIKNILRVEQPKNPPVAELPGSIPSTAKGMQTKLKPGQGGESGAIINPISAVKDVGSAVKNLVNLYSEPMIERLGRVGGKISETVGKEARQITSHAKRYYGELTPTVDAAKQASGKFMGAGTTWIRGIDKVNEKAAIGRAVGALEGGVNVPVKAQDMVNKLKAANLAIGQLAQRGAPGFIPSGKMQRILTSYGYDVIKRGRGPAWDAWAQGIADANGKPVSDVQRFLQKWKNELDAPGPDTAKLDKINQDFVRQYPKTVTHIKPGSAWHEVLATDPFNYLEQAAQRTAHAVAFREVYKPGSGLLEATRKGVQKELETNRYEGEFDNLMKSLQGHPLDQFTGWWDAPDTATGAAGRMAGQLVAAPIKAMVLTGNALTNLGEALVGGPTIFLGARNVGRGMIELAKDPGFYKQLEMTGAVNKALQNYAYDPASPVRSLARQAVGGLRKVSLQQTFNELQEAQAGASAKVVTNRIKAGDLGPGETQRVIATMRAMGFSETDALSAVNGKNVELLNQFETRAASWLTAGNQAMAEKSRLGASRAFNELFWFHSYPQMAFNQVRSVLGNLAEDVQSKNWKQAKANAELLGRQLGGRTLQGALTVGVLALAYEGMSGLKERKQEAQDELGQFAVQSYIAAMGGPLYLIKKGLESGGDSRALQQTTGSLIAPLSIGGELMDVSIGNGRFEGMNAGERVGAFVESKTPGYKAIKTGMALFGLSQEDRELATAMKAFYRWRRSEMGWRQEVSTVEDSDVQFRAQMRKAVRALENGKDWRKELIGDAKKVSASLYSRTVLKSPDGKPLTDEQLEKLKKRIGPELVEKLQLRDAMVREVARGLGDTKDANEVKDPTGMLAVDRETGTKRSDRVIQSLSKETQEFLKKNQVSSLEYTPDVGVGKKEDLIGMQDSKKMEEVFVKELETRLKNLQNPYFDTMPKASREKSIQVHVNAARKVAWARTREEVLKARKQK